MGKCVGIEARDLGTDIWYAPGVNIHRNPAGGRNYEYYSEDPVISGTMASAVITGCYSEGLVVTIKHFVMNDQESHREGVFTWADEQTMREIYLKAFEMPIKESPCYGVMSAFNRIGTTWCGGSSALLNDLLRGEWGFEGFVVSDYSWNFTGVGYMSPIIAVYNGNDTLLTGLWAINLPSHVIAVTAQYYADPIGFGTALREACKHLITVKMHTKAFQDPYEYDGSLSGALLKPEEWEFEKPYTISYLEYVINNVLNTLVYFAKFIV
jgi:beta-glucosidase